MDTWKGNVTSSVLSSVYQLPMVIDNFRLVNKTGGAITANVYLIDGDSQLSIIPLNEPISQNSMYKEDDTNIVVLATEQIKVQVSGSTDYDFTLSNLPTP